MVHGGYGGAGMQQRVKAVSTGGGWGRERRRMVGIRAAADPLQAMGGMVGMRLGIREGCFLGNREEGFYLYGRDLPAPFSCAHPCSRIRGLI